jgi:acyl dehydratase
MAGRYFDEWYVGDVITHEIRRTVTETDNLLFSTMRHNPQPLHIDREAVSVSRGHSCPPPAFPSVVRGG